MQPVGIDEVKGQKANNDQEWQLCHNNDIREEYVNKLNIFIYIFNF